MARNALEVADIVRLHGEDFARTHPLTLMQRKVLRNILRCRTAELGGHVYRCEGCGYEENSYNSCRDRHCPKCQGSKAKQWVEERTDELLPVSYYAQTEAMLSPRHKSSHVQSSPSRNFS
jgi:predicted Zn-ribbon and HTH transcriptional regulator